MKSPGSQIGALLLEQPSRRSFDITLERKTIYDFMPGTHDTVSRVAPGGTLPLRVRDLCAQGRTAGSSIAYHRETMFESNVFVPVAAGTPKPQSDLAYEVINSPVATIAAWFRVAKQLWQDFAMFEAWIDSRMLYGLAMAEENQLLNGDGVLPNLQGLMTVAQTVPPIFGIGVSAMLENLVAGIAFVYSQGFLANGIVVNPRDWAHALTGTGNSGNYLLGAPTGMSVPPTLFGIPLVVSNAMPLGNYLVGQFNPFAQVFDREDAGVSVSDEDQNDYVRNLVTVRGEERIALAVYQTQAFGKGTFTIA